MRSIINNLTTHPCFNRAAGQWFDSVHLAVAPRCNIKCLYCTKGGNCPHENNPGTTSRLLTPAQALKAVRNAVKKDRRISVVGIAGPGEPLANEQTFDVLRLVAREYPKLLRCVGTNGLLLHENIDRLLELGVRTVSVTVNAVNPYIAGMFCRWVAHSGEVYEGLDGASILVANQLLGIREAVKRGITVRVNSIVIPGINDIHLKEVAYTAKSLGASLMNLRPMVPAAEFSRMRPPNSSELDRAGTSVSPIIPLAPGCLCCRDHRASAVK